MPALFFGSISTVADTSELQRAAFNTAFAEHGLGWEWDREEYQSLLGTSGGRRRVDDYAEARDQQVDADAVHATKSTRYQETLGTTSISPRPGVVDSLRQAREAGWKTGLITTTLAANVRALLDALSKYVDADAFDLIVTVDDVATPKPAPDVYRYALERLDLKPEQAVAVEDNPGGAESARAAGVPCVAFPNENTGGLDFGNAPLLAPLNFTDLASLVGQDA